MMVCAFALFDINKAAPAAKSNSFLIDFFLGVYLVFLIYLISNSTVSTSLEFLPMNNLNLPGSNTLSISEL